MPYSETTWGYAKDTTSLDKWNDVLVSYAGNTITTDAIGNTLWDGLFSYTWQHGRQLARAQNSIIDITYSYNADGIRTSKTVKNTISNTNILHTYDLDGTTIVRECIYDTTGAYVETELRYYYDAKGAPVAMRAFKHDENGALLKDITCYFATNLQGDVVALYDKTGNRIASYTYDAWGNNIYKNSTATSNISTADAQWLMNINPFRYRGYYYDTDTGFYYLQSRYYNPQWGRFLNADGYVNANGDLIGFNMYAYCSNNPVMGYDPTGEADYGNFRKAVTYWLVFLLTPSSTHQYTLIKTYDNKFRAAEAAVQLIDLHYSRTELYDDYDWPDTYNPEWENAGSGFTTGVDANCHNFSAEVYGDHIKVMTGVNNEYEAIYNSKTKKEVTDPRDIGTYNFFDPVEQPALHVAFDVVPWILWGNSGEDSTNIFERGYYMVRGVWE